jgi:predicted nucleic acid-binding Zn ribbon protein
VDRVTEPDSPRRAGRPERRDAPVFESLPRARRVQRGNDGPQPIGELIMPMLARLGLKTRARHLQVMSAWPGVVGEAVAAGAHPTSYNRGRVVVETDSPALGHQLHLQQQLIIDKLNEAIGDNVVTNIRFKMGPSR